MTPAFIYIYIYIFVVFVSKNREKRSKKRKIDHFADCLSQYTRQSGLPQNSTWPLCRVLKPWHSAKFQTFAECQDPALGKAATWRHPPPWAGTLPSARRRHSANFAECTPLGTRQSAGPGWRHVAALPSAGSWHSANV